MNTALKFLFILLLFTIEAQPQRGSIKIYLIDSESPWDRPYDKNACRCCLEIQKLKIEDKPFLTDLDFASFDWEKQMIRLNESGKEKVAKFSFLEGPNRLPGTPAVVTLNQRPLYYLIIFPNDSSSGCDRVHTYLFPDRLNIMFGRSKYSSATPKHYGSDPRFDKRLEAFIEKQFTKK